MKRRIYLTLERGRDVCLRNLLRKVYLAAGTNPDGSKRTRVKVDEFAAGIKVAEARSSEDDKGDMEVDPVVCAGMENDEVECLLANQIYKVRSIIAGRSFELTKRRA